MSKKSVKEKKDVFDEIDKDKGYRSDLKIWARREIDCVTALELIGARSASPKLPLDNGD